MADKILYQNKEKLIDNTSIPDKNKVTANDMNEIKEVINAHADDIEELETIKANRTEIPTDLSELSNETTKFVNETQLAEAVLNEKTERQTADNNLQTQIDAITASSDIVDIVGTYQELLNYDTSKLTANDIIKVLSDNTHNNATSYYRWNNRWEYVGSEAPTYTKSETDSLLNQKANQSSLNETNQNVYALSGRVGTNESDIRNIKAEQITQNTQIATLVADSGNKIELSINSTNYVMTATLKNKAGTVLNTSSIDLPIEAMIVNARYDSATKELVLTLQNGNTIRVSIEDIIDGLVSQTDFDELAGRVTTVENIIVEIQDEQTTQNESIEELQEQVEVLTNTVESELEDATATGTSISVNDSANAPAKLLPSGNTYQETTSISEGDEYDSPSPEHEQTIHNVSGHNEFLVQNKNLGIENFNKKLTIVGTGQNRNVQTANYNIGEIIKVKANTHYIASGDFSALSGEVIRIGMFDEYPTENSITTKFVYGASGLDFATDVNTEYILICNASDLRDTIVPKLFICETALATSYVEHEEQTLDLDLPEGMEMCKIDSYQDKFIKQNGKWYLNKLIGKKTFSGSEYVTTLSNLNNNDTSWFQFTDAISDALDGLVTTNKKLLCNYLKIYNCYDVSKTQDGTCYHQDKKIQVRINNSNLSDLTNKVASFKSWVSSHNLIYYYILQTPTTTQITDTTLISQLDQMQKIISYYQQTNVDTISAGDLEAILTLGYKKSNNLRIQALENAILSLGGNI